MGRISKWSNFIEIRGMFRSGRWEVFLFFLFVGEPVLEVFGEDFHIFFLHNVVDDCGGDFQLDHSLVRPLPEPFLLGGGVGQIEVGYQLAEFLEHYRIEVIVIPRDYFFLIYGTFIFGHKFPFRIVYVVYRIARTSFTGNLEINQAAVIIQLVFAGFGKKIGYNS